MSVKRVSHLLKNQLEDLSKEDLIKKILSLQSFYGFSEKQNLTERKKQSNKKNKQKINPVFYRHIAIKVAYLGWNYYGLQDQPHIDDTIESLLRGALKKSGLVDQSDPVKLEKCGRTDKEVSSFAQVINLNIASKFSPSLGVSKPVKDVLEKTQSLKTNLDDNKVDNQIEFDYPLLLNKFLPRDIQIVAWSPIDDVFSARYDCKSREYRFYFMKGSLDVDLMKKAAKRFCGIHDFRNFAKISKSDRNVKSSIRKILKFEIVSCDSKVDEDCCIFFAKIKGSGFLHHQVRSMMTILFLVGLKLEKEDIISQFLDVSLLAYKPSYHLSAADSLTLYNCSYDQKFNWICSYENQKLLIKNFQRYWSELAIKTQMLKELTGLLVEDYKSFPDVEDLIHGANFHSLQNYIPKQMDKHKSILSRKLNKPINKKD